MLKVEIAPYGFVGSISGQRLRVRISVKIAGQPELQKEDLLFLSELSSVFDVVWERAKREIIDYLKEKGID